MQSPFSEKVPLASNRLVDGIKTRKTEDAGAEEPVDVNLIGEYSFCGWFIWEPT